MKKNNEKVTQRQALNKKSAEQGFLLLDTRGFRLVSKDKNKQDLFFSSLSEVDFFFKGEALVETNI